MESLNRLKCATKAMIQGNENIAAYVLLGVTLIMIVCLICMKFMYVDRLNTIRCDNMNSAYSTPNGYIVPINKNKYTNPLFDYYVKTAYNACSGGTIKNDVVDVCNLKAIIRQGVRCLDFEIYWLDGKPVVATSTSDNYHVKETLNSVPFSNAMSVINDHAFSSGSDGAPNASDPLFIHLRIKSNDAHIYDELVRIFDLYRRRLLGPKYSYEYKCHEKSHCNFGGEPIHKFMNKMIIVVDATNKTYLDHQKFYEFVNMTSNSAFMRSYHYYDVKNTPDVAELQDYNRRAFTIVYPDKGSNPYNPSGITARELGCQFVAMRYQSRDSYLDEDDLFFNEGAHAFVLKPEKLRYNPIIIDDPIPQDPSLSYADRDIKGLPKGVELSI